MTNDRGDELHPVTRRSIGVVMRERHAAGEHDGRPDLRECQQCQEQDAIDTRDRINAAFDEAFNGLDALEALLNLPLPVAGSESSPNVLKLTAALQDMNLAVGAAYHNWSAMRARRSKGGEVARRT